MRWVDENGRVRNVQNAEWCGRQSVLRMPKIAKDTLLTSFTRFDEVHGAGVRRRGRVSSRAQMRHLPQPIGRCCRGKLEPQKSRLDSSPVSLLGPPGHLHSNVPLVLPLVHSELAEREGPGRQRAAGCANLPRITKQSEGFGLEGCRTR